jgi:uncharacterized membrane protein YdbT with pleckstrin-like domain
MSYASSHLIPGEKIVYETRLHWIILAWQVIFALVLLFTPGIALLYYYRSNTNVEWLAAALIVIGVIVVLAGTVRRNATEMAVTNKRVLIKQGITSRRTLEILLQKVESIAVEESLMGRMLGFGTVIVKGTGGTPESFTRMASPLQFRSHVEQQIAALGT